jgi:hypothetical protein
LGILSSSGCLTTPRWTLGHVCRRSCTFALQVLALPLRIAAEHSSLLARKPSLVELKQSSSSFRYSYRFPASIPLF